MHLSHSLLLILFLSIISVSSHSDDDQNTNTQVVENTNSPESSEGPQIEWPEHYQIEMPNLGPEYYADLKTWDYQSGFMGEHFYERLEYDTDNDSMIEIDKPVLLTIKENRAILQEVANKYPDVQPATIAACILAENTMNVGISDSAQNWLAGNSKTMFSIGAAMFGKDATSVSVGFGQINLEAARTGEPYVQQVESRVSPRTDDEILAALLTFDGAFKYAAGIIQEAIDAYKEEGIDIRSRPDLQCTLYNLGGAKERAQRTKERGTLPKPNYFGFFVNHYYDEIKSEIGIEDNTPIQAPLSIKYRTTEVIDEMTMYPSIDSCDGTTTHLAPTNTRTLRGRYTEVGHSIDCDLMAWTMVQDSAGYYGWVPSYSLQLNSKFTAIPEEEFLQSRNNQCLSPSYVSLMENCLQRIKNLGLQVEKVDGANIVIKPFEQDIATMANSFDQINKNSLQAWDPYIIDAKQKILDRLESNSIHLNSWDDPKNPFKDAFKWYDEELQECVNVNPLCRIKSPFGSFVYFQAYMNAIPTLDTETYLQLMDTLKAHQVSATEDFSRPFVTAPRVFGVEDKANFIKFIRQSKDNLIQHINELNALGDNHSIERFENAFEWINEYENCKTCGINFPTFGNNLESYFQLVSTPAAIVSTPMILEVIGQTRIVPLSSVKLPEDIEGRPLLNFIGENLNQCRDYYDQERYSHFPSFIAYIYNTASNINPDNLTNNAFHFRLKSAVDKIGEECRLNKICKEYELSQEWSDCNMFNNDFDISFFCDINGSRLNSSIESSLADLMCITKNNAVCKFSGYGIDQVNQLAELPCVNQINFSHLRGMEAFLNDPRTSNKVKGKAVYFNYDEVHFISITINGACLNHQSMVRGSISSQ